MTGQRTDWSQVFSPRERQQWEAKLPLIIRQTWLDEGFRVRFASEPHVVLQEYGLPLPVGVVVQVREDVSHLAVCPSSQGVLVIIPLLARPAVSSLSSGQKDTPTVANFSSNFSTNVYSFSSNFSTNAAGK